ncbi:MAG TPA: BamA/TamA family outer membrane protein [Candidatus Krumholzibacteria bacterium]|nr:BamA/TamA family outer membrane protein [Candidatus Krumholzibacteria bacterium]
MRTVSRFVAAAALLPALAFSPEPARANFTAASLTPYDGFFVTRVDVEGCKVTKEYIVHREIRIQPGDTFRVADAQADLTRLENLGIFSSGEIVAAATDSSVALTYRVREMPWIVPFPRVRYTEQDGWSFGAGVSSVNMHGRATRLSGSFLLGGLDSWSVRYRYPWITGNHISFDFFASDFEREDDLNEFREHSFELTPWFGSYIKDHGRVGLTVSYFQMKSDRDGITLSGDRRDRFLRVGGRIGHDSRDNWRNPCRGWLHDFLALYNDGGTFGEPGQWWLAEADVRRYQPLDDKLALIAGALVSYQDGQVGADIPGYMQYRMGGANSIRGYDIDVLGQEVYGRNQAIVTAEVHRVLSPMRERFIGKWSYSAGVEAAAFVDWGIAWSGSDEFDDKRARTGFGLGLRWLLPAVFEVRTDVAMGEDGKAYFHLGVGEKLNAQRARLR